MKRNTVLVLVGVLAAVAVAVSLGFYWPGRDHDVLKLPGTVEVHELRLGSKVGGRVAEVFVREGHVVAEGTDLLRFEAPELEAQRDQLKQKLVAANAEWQKARDGLRPQEKVEVEQAMKAAAARWERVKKGWRDEEVKQAQHDLAASDADLDYARKNFERIRELSAANQDEKDIAHSRFIVAESKAHSARTRYAMLRSGSRDEDKNDAEAEFLRTRARHELAQAGTRDEDKAIAKAVVGEIEAKLREIEASLKETVVRAPSPLVVEVLSVRKGDLVPANQPVVRALLAEERWVKVFAPQNELGTVHVGDTAEVTCDSFPGRTFAGTVVQIATVSEFTPRNVQSVDERRHQVFAVKVRVDDPEGVFKSGMAAEVRLTRREAK